MKCNDPLQWLIIFTKRVSSPESNYRYYIVCHKRLCNNNGEEDENENEYGNVIITRMMNMRQNFLTGRSRCPGGRWANPYTAIC